MTFTRPRRLRRYDEQTDDRREDVTQIPSGSQFREMIWNLDFT